MLSHKTLIVADYCLLLIFSFVSMALGAPIDLAKTNFPDTSTIRVIRYDRDSPYLKFALPYSASQDLADEAQKQASYLAIELRLHTIQDGGTVKFNINGNLHDTSDSELAAGNLIRLQARDLSDVEHKIELISEGIPSSTIGLQPDGTADDSHARNLWRRRFLISSIDGESLLVPIYGFSVSLALVPQPRFVSLKSENDPSTIDLALWEAMNRGTTPSLAQSNPLATPVALPQQTFQDFLGDVKYLLQLEIQAKSIQQEILEKQQTISEYMKAQRNSISLDRLIRECESLRCTAQVVAQRISDRFGLASKPSARFSTISESEAISAQRVFATDASDELDGFDTKVQGLRILLSQNATTGEYGSINIINPPDLVIHAMQLVCTAMGLLIILSAMRNRCMSLRHRTEHAADLEQREATRDYQRAARKAAFRKRWNKFLTIFCCCFAREDNDDDFREEKRALIIQDAFLEDMNDQMQAEKCQIMEAEIRELRYAHEIVSRLVRVEGQEFMLTHDPPPSLISLPPVSIGRSRASTMTLPSYTSECLPGYTSGPDDLDSLLDCQSVSMSDDSESTGTCTCSTDYDHALSSSSSSSRSGCCNRRSLTSSVADVSPRLSEETLCNYIYQSKT